jgi:hypothetical protein
LYDRASWQVLGVEPLEFGDRVIVLEFSAGTPSLVDLCFLESLMGNRLYVGNLPYTARDEDLSQAFGAFGEVKSARVMMERETGRSKGFGFVEMGDDAMAQAAIQGMHGQQLGGRALVVNEARPAEPRTGGFGGGGGRGGYGGGGNRGGYGGGGGGGYRSGGGGGYNAGSTEGGGGGDGHDGRFRSPYGGGRDGNWGGGGGRGDRGDRGGDRGGYGGGRDRNWGDRGSDRGWGGDDRG